MVTWLLSGNFVIKETKFLQPVWIETLNKLNFPAPVFNPLYIWMRSMYLSGRLHSRSDEVKQMRDAASAGSLTSLWKITFSRFVCCRLPWVTVWRAFTLLNAERVLLHLSCLCYLIGGGCHQSYAADLAWCSDQWSERFWPWTHPCQSTQICRGYKDECSSKTGGWVFMSAVKSST